MFFSLILIFAGIASGYAVQRWMTRSGHPGDSRIAGIRKSMQRWILMVIIPFTAAGSLWTAPLRHVEILALPFLGGLSIILGGGIAFLISRPLGLDRGQTAVFTVAGGFTNMGSLGGLIVFLFLGEPGFALVAFYQLFEKFIYFLAGFPLAKSRSRYSGEKSPAGRILLDTLKDPVIIINSGALVLGTVLNLSGVSRPGIFPILNQILVPLGSAGLLFSIGLAMRFGSMKSYRLAGLTITVIKSLAVPAVIFTLGFLLGLGRIADGLVLKFLLILSAMPVGFMAMVPPTLYDMDLDLANTCWLFSNAGLAAVIPLLGFLLPLIG